MTAGTTREASAILEAGPVDAILLDRMLPGGDGLTWLAGVGAGGVNCPVLIITAREAVEDRIEGLDCGADDYLIKPLSYGELLARLRALLRRAGPLHPAGRGGSM